MGSTHYSKLAGKTEVRQGMHFPTDPFDGQEFYSSALDILYIYDRTNGVWRGEQYSTTTSTSSSTSTTTTSTSTTTTSTSTTTTSTSTTTTSTSSSTTTTISTSTSTSTTTTL